MDYLLYSLSFLALVTGTLLYLLRARWLPLVHDLDANLRGSGSYLYSRLTPWHHRDDIAVGASFEDDIEAGLTSSTFDLAGNNVAAGDARAGLDDAAKKEILKIMKKRRMRFDEARRVYMEQRFREHGIGPDGLPRDPKFVSFS
ncbi:hypothetical protein VTJ83DRAFT_1235 [Remersonia thermophila]|uniref:Uncharacterized protein n=1 Tax=Remersonia thermophila TaxID=72144 RepID=A0ABR4DP22_9PEZI